MILLILVMPDPNGSFRKSRQLSRPGKGVCSCWIDRLRCAGYKLSELKRTDWSAVRILSTGFDLFSFRGLYDAGEVYVVMLSETLLCQRQWLCLFWKVEHCPDSVAEVLSPPLAEPDTSLHEQQQILQFMTHFPGLRRMIDSLIVRF